MAFTPYGGHREHRQPHSFGVNDGSYVLSNSNMDTPSQSVETDSNLAQTMTNLPGPSQRTPSELQSVGPGMMAMWWQSPKDEPWTIFKTASTQHSKNRPSTMSLSNSGLSSSFTTYRGGPTAPSDCDTSPGTLIQSDSGYASGHPQSVGNPSVYGDVTESQSLIGPLSSFQLSSELGGEVSHSDDYGRHPLSWSHHGPPRPPQLQTVASEVGTPNRANLWCSVCAIMLKTKSELNKHKARHERPWACNVPGCKRSDGFGTKNDLERHTRSCHGGEGIGAWYVCSLGQCASVDKRWPRWDNFKQHLKRSHQKTVRNDQREEYQYRGPQSDPNNDLAHLGAAQAVGEASVPSAALWPGSHNLYSNNVQYGRPTFDPVNPQTSNCPRQDHDEESNSNGPIAEQLRAGVGGIDHELQADQEAEADEITISDDLCAGDPDYGPTDALGLDQAACEAPTPKEIVAVSEAFAGVDSDDRIAGLTAPGGVSRTDEDMADSVAQGAMNADDKVKSDVPTCSGEEHDSSPASVSTDEDSDEGTPGPLETAAPKSEQDDATPYDHTVLEHILENGRGSAIFDRVLEKFGFQRMKDSTPKTKKASQAQRTTRGDQQRFSCDHCKKTFKRPCELKKHNKRHSRPYCCTSAGCSKKFGSKNDWKRHENSQHFQVEVWKCQEKVKEDASEICRKVCHRRETLKYHLQKDHHVLESEALDQKMKGCRAGNECGEEFWCGFCKKMITLQKTGEDGWTERYDHIDLHFTGREGWTMQDISEWKHREGEDVSIDPAGDKRSHQEDDSEDSETERKVTTTKHGSRKRSGPDQASGSRAKRPKSAKETTWFCCQCNQYWNGSLSTQCVECQHYSCPGCRVGRKEYPNEA